MTTGYPDQLYTSLTAETARICGLQTDEEKAVEACFAVCTQYDRRLHLWLHEFHFPGDTEEISFFKTCKPRFSSMIYYYTKCYQSIMLKPQDAALLAAYYEYETDKVNKFFIDNAAFYSYYQAGATDRDREYFMRTSREKSAKDMLLGEIIGLEKYKEYIRDKLGSL